MSTTVEMSSASFPISWSNSFPFADCKAQNLNFFPVSSFNMMSTHVLQKLQTPSNKMMFDNSFLAYRACLSPTAPSVCDDCRRLEKVATDTGDDGVTNAEALVSIRRARSSVDSCMMCSICERVPFLDDIVTAAGLREMF